MNKRLLGSLFLFSFAALAAPPAATPAVDAFLSRRDVKPLVDARALTSIGRDALSKGFISSTEPRLGVPTFFWSSPQLVNGRTFREMGLTPEEAARRFLLTHIELYRGEASRWAEARVTGVHDLHDGGAVIVTFQQRINGVRVFRDELKVIMNAKLQLVALAGYLTPETRVRGSFSLSSQSSIESAFQHLTGRALDAGALSDLGQFGGGYEHWQLAGSSTPVRTRAVFFPVPEGVIPGYYVELDVPVSETDSAYFSYVVSAVDGSVLYRKNLTAADAYTYKVWADPTTFVPMDGPQGLDATPHPTGAPNGFVATPVAQNLVTLENAGLSTMDPWLAPASQNTRGNNVVAYADIARNNGFTQGMDPIGTTNGANTFDYTYSFTQSPSMAGAQQQAAIVQLFFNNNFFHDWYYDDGFNEAAGNGQTNNLGRGGVGNDPVLSEAQDYSGTDNANMSTPSDGASPRMQMYLFNGSATSTITANTTSPQNFGTIGADFGPQTFTTTAPLMLANDGDATPTDGCNANWPAMSATGKIVLIDRGTCTFVDKALHAQAAGAVGVIIANNNGNAIPMPGTGAVTIPTMSVSTASGTTLKSIITSGGGATTVTLTQSAAIDKDGTVDNGVVAHEWGHYISNRLIGDGNGISNLQAGGMGEGWGDFHAALLVSRAADINVASNANWNGSYALAGWAGSAADPEAYYYGFRRYPLSYSFTRNPLTFKHISDGVALPNTAPVAFGASGQGNSEVHNTGEVWAVMLWDCYVMLLRDSRYTFDQARAKMKRYLVGAYKATPLMPTFVDARDAVLAMAAADDATNFASFWAAFARRGLGMAAIAPDRDSQSNSPLTEDFTVGNAIVVTDVTLDDSGQSCDNDGNLDANERGVMTVRLRNTGTGTLNGSMVSVTSSTPGISFPTGATQSLPSTAPFGTATLSFQVALADVQMPQGGMFTVTVADASLAMGNVTKQAMFRLNYDVVPNSSRIDDVEAPTSQWTASSDPNGNTGSNFRIFQDTATEHYWFGPNPASPADTWLTSPPLSVGTGPLTITFQHRWDFERSTTEYFDGAVIEVSTNNSTWTDVGSKIPAPPAMGSNGYNGTISTSQNQSANPIRGQRAFVGKSAGYPAFVTTIVNLDTMYAGQSALRFRFRIGADDAAAAKGWEIDNIQVSGITNLPFTSVTSDPNSCSNQAPVATIGPNIEVTEGQTVTLVGSGTDPDNDPVTVTWTQISGPPATINGAQFTAPMVNADAMVVLQMTVTDGRAVTLPLEQQVLVKNVNMPPVATAPATMDAQQGTIVTVFGTGSDPEQDPITFEWTQVSGPTVALSGANTDTVAFLAPMVADTDVVRLQLIVRDPTQASAPAFTDITVRNPNPTMTVTPMPKGCGCTSGFELIPLALLGLLVRSRRRR